MRHLLFPLLLSFILFFPLESTPYEQNILLGPEIYGIWRKKEGGGRQDGIAYGARVQYERIVPWKLYAAVDFIYAKADLCGKLEDCRLKSHYTDANLEERLGYSLAMHCFFDSTWTPFIGYGRIWENNDYVHPSPSHFHFKNDFTYVPAGFLSSFQVTEALSVGLNFKARFILNGQNLVSNDPENGKIVQHYDEKVQYRIEIPISWETCVGEKALFLELVPFWEMRHYGKRANFPFDFLDTKFTYVGATLKIGF